MATSMMRSFPLPLESERLDGEPVFGQAFIAQEFFTVSLGETTGTLSLAVRSAQGELPTQIGFNLDKQKDDSWQGEVKEGKFRYRVLAKQTQVGKYSFTIGTVARTLGDFGEDDDTESFTAIDEGIEDPPTKGMPEGTGLPPSW